MKQQITRLAGKTGLTFKKYLPEILLTTGVIGLVTSTVMVTSSKRKERAEQILDKVEKDIEGARANRDGLELYKYSNMDYRKEVSLAYGKMAVDYVALYGPPVSLGVASLVAIFGSHNIMRKRNIAVMAAYKGLETSFAKYRERVIDAYGKEKDFEFRHGATKTKVKNEETGKEEELMIVDDTNNTSIYSRFFDEASRNWNKNPEYNLVFLKAQQNYANDLLHARGHLFLNEVYDMLDIPHSQAGAVVGWRVSKDGDNYVDFGIYDVHRANRDFVNGYERSILLDFNVDGVIFDRIEDGPGDYSRFRHLKK